jgi:hypothetical protein
MPSESKPSFKKASGRCRRCHEKVVEQAEHLLELAVGSDERFLSRSASVSAWSIGQHLVHLAKANLKMAGAIRKILAGDAGPSRSGPTLVGRAVLTSGWIPRGVGVAPDYTTPESTSPGQIEESLRMSLAAVRELGGSLSEIDRSRGRLDHFAFGGLCPMQWLRALDVHTRHHLKIIRDIERAG